MSNTNETIQRTVLSSEEINTIQENITKLVHKIKQCEIELTQSGSNHFLYCCELGKMLIQVKWSLPHGHFRPWMKKHFTFTYRTAQNYMALSKAKRVSLLMDCEGLNEAYLKIGLKKPTSVKKSKTNDTTEDQTIDSDDTPKEKKKETTDNEKAPDLSLPEKVEQTVDQLEEMIFGHEDERDIMFLIEPLVVLYNNFMKLHNTKTLPVVNQEPVMDLNERPIKTSDMVGTNG